MVDPAERDPRVRRLAHPEKKVRSIIGKPGSAVNRQGSAQSVGRTTADSD
jgi:hypothetical protein